MEHSQPVAAAPVVCELPQDPVVIHVRCVPVGHPKGSVEGFPANRKTPAPLSHRSTRPEVNGVAGP